MKGEYKDGEGFILIGLRQEGKWFTVLIEFKNVDVVAQMEDVSKKLLDLLEEAGHNGH